MWRSRFGRRNFGFRTWLVSVGGGDDLILIFYCALFVFNYRQQGLKSRMAGAGVVPRPGRAKRDRRESQSSVGSVWPGRAAGLADVRGQVSKHSLEASRILGANSVNVVQPALQARFVLFYLR